MPCKTSAWLDRRSAACRAACATAPAQFERRRVVLRHLVRRSFEPGVRYSEKEVDEKLRAWYESSATDHVTLRRYLIDLCLLGREDGGAYWLREDMAQER